MSLRFTRRVSILPGLVNLSKSGASVSIGHRSLWWTIGSRGQRVTAGLPGSGLFWSQRIPPAPAPHAGHQAREAPRTLAGAHLEGWGLFPAARPKMAASGRSFQSWRPSVRDHRQREQHGDDDDEREGLQMRVCNGG